MARSEKYDNSFQVKIVDLNWIEKEIERNHEISSWSFNKKVPRNYVAYKAYVGFNSTLTFGLPEKQLPMPDFRFEMYPEKL